ncbi:MAG: hypothetical protein ACLFNR_00105 [Candidatus Paceibacterota bacterium]
MAKQKKILIISSSAFFVVILVMILSVHHHLLASTEESLEPGSILEIDNLSPNDVSIIQDDPDDPQNNDWLTADDHDNDTLLRVDFSTSTNPLKEGSDLQEFRVLVRSTNNGANDPDVSLYLYENGSEVAVLKTGTATSTEGQVISGSWDASLLNDVNGSDVELKVVGSSTEGQSGEIDTVEIGAVKWEAQIEDPELVQDQYRFYENRDDTTPTVELAGENEKVTAVAQDEVIRLRANVLSETNSIPEDTLQMKLQYAALGEESDCSALATTTFSDIGAVDSSEIWRGFSNSTTTDGEDLSSVLLSLSDVRGTYEEENPSALLPRLVGQGERVEWDFTLQNNGAESGEPYCFRMVKSDDVDLFRYDRFPQAEAVRGLTQVKYRWRNDDGGENSATWKEAENTPTSFPVDQNVRLRFQIDNEGNVSDDADLRLEYATSTAGSWSTVPVDNPECDTTSSDFRICGSDHLTDGATTTRQLSEISGSTFMSGYILDDSNPASSTNFLIDEYTEMEWSIQATEAASFSEKYYFRLSDQGETIGTYSEFPEAEVEGDNAVLTQNYYRWYEHNDQLTPDSAWSGLGENTAVTSSDDPPKQGNALRLRMSLTVSDDLLPADSRNFDLQYAEREGSCSATTGWSDVGDIDSAEIWRGTSTAVSDGSELSTLLLSVSDIAGTFEEENPSALNPNEVLVDNDVEYDWVLEHNGAKGDTAYCFRMVESDGTTFSDHNYYPTLTTAGFTPESDVWRWYGDTENVTPTQALADENVSPTNVDFDDVLKLRIAVAESVDVDGEDIKFALEYSENSSFSSGVERVSEIEKCEDEESLWCYADGGGQDGEVISETLLSSTDDCVDGVGDGCGTHNESGTSTSDFDHLAGAVVEYEFTIRQAGALTNTGYYFRLVEAESGDPVSTSEEGSYPSVSTAGSDLVFSITGVPKGETINSIITTDVDSSPTSIPFGSLPMDQRVDAAQRKTVETNAPGGFKIYMYKRNPFASAAGDQFEPIKGTNGSPSSWSSGCEDLPSCYGYHVGDDTLDDSSTRFAPDDSFAAFSQDPAEVGYSGIPDREYSVDTVLSLEAREDQPAGDYVMSLVYVIVPIF